MPAAPSLKAIEGKYEILEKISEGGMGAVYKVRHRLLEGVRVVKVMRPHLAADAEMKGRFLREAKLAGSLRHANIAAVYDFAIEDDGNAFLIMEYIPGVTLQELLRHSGPPPIGLALDIAGQCLEALAYLHGRGIIHRDLAPDNVMLTRAEDGRPIAKLIDLGIAKLVGADSTLTAAGSFVGKVKYASPEPFRAIEDNVRVDHRSDLYSFGLVLYEMLTGAHPIGETNVTGYIAGHLLHPPTPFAITDPKARVPDDLRAVVLKALAKDPEDRHADAAEMARQLAAIRGRFDLGADEVDRALEGMALPERGARVAPGSTQDRLNERFPLTSAPPEPPGAKARGRRRSVPAVVPTVEKTLDLGGDRFRTRPAGAETAGDRLPREARRHHRVPALVAAAAAIIAALVGWQLLERGASPPAGRLEIDARPWAEVVRVVGSDGAEVSFAHPAHTPMALTLAPGLYRIVLRRDDVEKEVSAQVTAGASTRSSTELADIAAEELFTNLGWSSSADHGL